MNMDARCSSRLKSAVIGLSITRARVVRECMKAGLVGGEGFAIDASVIEADARRTRRVEGKLTTLPDGEEVTRPVREYLDALDMAAAAENTKSADDVDDEPPGNPPSEPKFTSLRSSS